MTWRVQLLQCVVILRDLLSLSLVDPRMSLRFLGILHNHSPANSRGGMETREVACDSEPVCHISHRYFSFYFVFAWDSMVTEVVAMFQSWDHMQAYAFPPLAMIRLA